LRERIETMTTILKRRRENGGPTEPTGRTLEGCVMVMIWSEEDGTDSVSIVGDENISQQKLRDVLQEWLSPVVLDEKEGFVPAPYLD
jgi:hypothetical protein